MKDKMTLNEFKAYVITEAKKLYKASTLNEEKKDIENKISVLNECVPPTFDKDGNPSYTAGAPLNPEFWEKLTRAKVRAEMHKKAVGWDFSGTE